MRKFNLLKWGLLSLFCALTTMVGATTYTSTFGSGTTVNGDGRNAYDDGDEFFVFTRAQSGSSYSNNVSGDKWGSVTYDGEEYTYGFKMESSSSISFTTTEPMVLTVLFGVGSSENYEISIETKDADHTVQASPVTETNEDGGLDTLYYQLTKTLGVGEHTLYVAIEGKSSSKQSAIFYISATSCLGASWDWANDLPEGIREATDFNGGGSIESTVDGLYMKVDGSSGKFTTETRTDDCEFDAGAILYVPVGTEGDVVDVVGNEGYSYYKFGDSGDELTNTQSYTATAEDAENGYVQVISTRGSYLQSVSVYLANGLDSIDSQFLKSNVHLISEAPEDTIVAYISENTEISIQTVNISDITAVVFYVDSVGAATGTHVYADSLTVDASDPTIWSGATSEQINFNAGAKYNAYVEVTDTVAGENNPTTTSYDLYTVEGKYNIEITCTASPDPDNDDALKSNEDATITLTYSEPVLIDLDQLYIPMGQDSNLAIENVTNNESDTSKAATEWTITVGKDTVALFGRTVMTINVVAADVNENILLGNEEGNSWFEYKVDLVVDDIEITTIPADNDTIESLTSVTIQTNDVYMTWGDTDDYEAAIIVYNADGDSITCGRMPTGSEEEEEIWGTGGLEIGYTIPLDTEITASGVYTIVIPEGLFILTNGDSDYSNAELTITVTIENDDDDLTTAINGVTLQTTGDNKFYNLNGQRVTTPHNGVYILNGKKILVK